jgi:cell division protein FtsW
MSNSLLARISLRNPFANDSPLVTALAAVTAFMSFIGLFMVLSASSVTSGLQNDGNFYAEAITQTGSALIGSALAMFMARLPIDFWRKNRNYFVLIGVALQSAVLIYGNAYGGNKNWITILGVSVQPSEFLKLAIIVWFASWIHDNEHLIQAPLSYWRDVGIWVGIPLLLVIGGQDLGTTMILTMIILGMMAFAGVPGRTIGAVGVIAAVGALLIVNVGGSGRGSRLTTWLEGCAPADYETTCWQTIHGLWALSAGGLFGVGPGSSRAKWSWLPHADSDYIFAIVGEELGLFGAVGLILLFLALGVILIRLIREFPQPLTRVLIGGVFVWIIGQAFVNIAVVLNLLPVLGVPLPFISSGGSALLANFLAIGVVFSCVRYEEKYG